MKTTQIISSPATHFYPPDRREGGIEPCRPPHIWGFCHIKTVREPDVDVHIKLRRLGTRLGSSALRARQIQNGSRPLIDDQGRKPTQVAQEEVLQDLVSFRVPDEIAIK